MEFKGRCRLGTMDEGVEGVDGEGFLGPGELGVEVESVLLFFSH